MSIAVEMLKFPEIRVAIGVIDYKMTLKLSCLKLGHCKVTLTLSFELEGDLLGSALNDDIDCTVDYAQLGKFIAAELQKLRCDSLDEALNILKPSVLQFSPRIIGGFLEVSGMRHRVSFKNRCLL